MKNIIITGATGMIGNLVLLDCLAREDVNRVTVIARRATGVKHAKLTEVLHENFLDFSDIENHFQNQDICFYCLGVYTGQVSKEKFREITVGFTKSFAETLRRNNQKTTLCFLSGQGADLSEKSSMMFARDKGTAENILTGLQFEQTYFFRPGYIYPVQARKEPNLTYRISRWLYKPFLSKLSANMSITSEELATAMILVGFQGWQTNVLENREILNALKELRTTS